jgi:hypothetical protein
MSIGHTKKEENKLQPKGVQQKVKHNGAVRCHSTNDKPSSLGDYKFHKGYDTLVK